MKIKFNKIRNNLIKRVRLYKLNKLQGKRYTFIIMNRNVSHKVMWLKNGAINRNSRFGGGWDTSCGFQKGGKTILIFLCWSSTRIDLEPKAYSKYIWFKRISTECYDIRGERTVTHH